MDDIFEQMLSTSPWEDGVGMNRAAWDAVNTMAIDSTMELQSLPKVPTMPLMPLMGGLQEGSERVHTDGTLEHNQGLGVHAHHHMQSMAAPPWNQSYMAGMSQGPLPLSRGKSDTFLLQGEGIHRDIHLGKRVRNEDELPLEGHPENMMNRPGLQPGGYSGDQQGMSNEDPAGTAANAAVKPRVRARRGQATDPHSIAERNRRERIAERLRALQELVPDSNKTDKASMLDEIIGYVKFLQMQVKCLSMCRLGNAGAAVPLLADLPTEGPSSFLAAANLAQAHGGSGTSQEGMALAERQVAQLMDEDMSAAMQYLQSKGLCLMPISLATAISSTGARQEALAPMDSKAAAASNNGSASTGPNNTAGKEKAVGNPVQTTKDTQKDEKCG